MGKGSTNAGAASIENGWFSIRPIKAHDLAFQSQHKVLSSLNNKLKALRAGHNLADSSVHC